MHDDPFLAQRRRMVEHQLVRRHIRSPAVLNALSRVPREAFVPVSLRHLAYADQPLPIGSEQTISQPYVVAMMSEALDLQGGGSVLEVGTGSGYAAAVLSLLCARVFTIERFATLADKAARTLATNGYSNVWLRLADGHLGWDDHAPYDAIVVTACSSTIPMALKAQLKIGGRLVMPLGTAGGVQTLVRVTRHDGDFWRSEEMMAVRFVPLLHGIAGDHAGRSPTS